MSATKQQRAKAVARDVIAALSGVTYCRVCGRSDTDFDWDAGTIANEYPQGVCAQRECSSGRR